MTTTAERLARSQAPGGPHHFLASLVGEWEGTTKTWFEPGQLADESPVRGTIRAALDGRFVIHEYAGSLGDKPLQGLAIYGYHLDAGAFTCAWVNSFHTGTEILNAQGGRDGDRFAVLAHYGGHGGAEAWGWRTEIEHPEPDKVVITAYNISPEGDEAVAVETVYIRVR